VLGVVLHTIEDDVPVITLEHDEHGDNDDDYDQVDDNHNGPCGVLRWMGCWATFCIRWRP
jgi:hypothetical protein